MSCFHLNLFRIGHGVPPPVPSLAMGLVEGLTASDAIGVSLGAGTTVAMAVANCVAMGAMMAVFVGIAVATGFTLARQVQPPSVSRIAVSTAPKQIRILFRFKGHTSFFK